MTKPFSKRLAVLAVVAVIAACVVLFVLPATEQNAADTQNELDGYLSIHFLDVGQGDCTLICTPDGKNMLIDAGTFGYRYHILEYLDSLGVSELEYVLFTHPHEDHIGAGSLVIDSFDVRNVIMTKRTSNTSTYENMADSAQQSKSNKGTSIIDPKVGDTYSLSDASFSILSADTNNNDTNDSSICLRFTYGDCSFMFTGDAGTSIENKILELDTELSSILLKCGHHGSSSSTSKRFLKAVYPTCAVISCGKDNDYGHPHWETEEILEKNNVTSFRTDLMGDIVFYCDGQSLYTKNN